MRAYKTLVEQENPTLMQFLSSNRQPASSPRSSTGNFGSRYSRDQWWSIFRYSNRELISRQSVRVQTSNFTRFYNMFGPDSYIEQPQAYGRQMQQQFRIPWVVSGSANNWEDIARNLDTILRQAEEWESEQGEQANRLSDEVIEEIAQAISEALRGVISDNREVFYQLGRLGNQEDYDRLREIYPTRTLTNVDIEEQLNRFNDSEKQTLQQIFNERNIRTGIDFSNETAGNIDISSIVDGDPDEVFETTSEIRRYFSNLLSGYVEQLNNMEDERGDAFFDYVMNSESQNGQFFRNILSEYSPGISKDEFDSRFEALLRLINLEFLEWYNENY